MQLILEHSDLIIAGALAGGLAAVAVVFVISILELLFRSFTRHSRMNRDLGILQYFLNTILYGLGGAVIGGIVALIGAFVGFSWQISAIVVPICIILIAVLNVRRRSPTDPVTR